MINVYREVKIASSNLLIGYVQVQRRLTRSLSECQRQHWYFGSFEIHGFYEAQCNMDFSTLCLESFKLNSRGISSLRDPLPWCSFLLSLSQSSRNEF